MCPSFQFQSISINLFLFKFDGRHIHLTVTTENKQSILYGNKNCNQLLNTISLDVTLHAHPGLSLVSELVNDVRQAESQLSFPDQIWISNLTQTDST